MSSSSSTLTHLLRLSSLVSPPTDATRRSRLLSQPCLNHILNLRRYLRLNPHLACAKTVTEHRPRGALKQRRSKNPRLRLVKAVEEETQVSQQQDDQSTSEQQPFAVPVSPSDTLTLSFQAEGTLNESAIPAVTKALKGLNTLNPVLILDDKWKLIGEYQGTIGTCIVFSEEDTPVIHEETGPSEANLFSGTKIIDSSQPPTKQVKPTCQFHKVLKFRVAPDSEIQAGNTEQAK